MTTREFLSAVKSNSITDEVIAFAETEIAKMDSRNEARKAKPSKAQLANEPIKVAILDAVRSGKHLSPEIAQFCNVTTQKASALCTMLVEEGKLAKAEVKVKGAKGSHKAMSYTLA